MFGFEHVELGLSSKNGIKDLVDSYRVYPITCLTTLTKAEKDQLLILDCITIKDLVLHPDYLNHRVKSQSN